MLELAGALAAGPAAALAAGLAAALAAGLALIASGDCARCVAQPVVSSSRTAGAANRQFFI